MTYQSSWLLALLFICVTLAVVYGTSDSELYESKEVAEKRPFFVGSRYGRSNTQRQVVPRNDRFFLGSRYGKRSAGATEDGFPAIKITTPEVTCLYTGVLNLYKCFGNVQQTESEE